MHLYKLYTTISNVIFSSQQNNSKYIKWDQLKKLYEVDTSKGVGMRIVPKLKFEHINLTSFSKMRVDLAAQVQSLYNAYHYVQIM